MTTNSSTVESYLHAECLAERRRAKRRKAKRHRAERQNGGSAIDRKATSFVRGELNHILSSVQVKILPAGMRVYRCNSGPDDDKLTDQFDKDTGKSGQYFSDGQIIPLGMILEYAKPLYLYEYEVSVDIEVYVGKYSFRHLEPTRFYNNYDEWLRLYHQGYGNAGINGIGPLRHTNSIQSGALPIHRYFGPAKYEIINENEIFLTSSGTNNWEDVKFVNKSGPINVVDATIQLDDLIDQSNRSNQSIKPNQTV